MGRTVVRLRRTSLPPSTGVLGWPSLVSTASLTAGSSQKPSARPVVMSVRTWPGTRSSTNCAIGHASLRRAPAARPQSGRHPYSGDPSRGCRNCANASARAARRRGARAHRPCRTGEHSPAALPRLPRPTSRRPLRPRREQGPVLDDGVEVGRQSDRVDQRRPCAAATEQARSRFQQHTAAIGREPGIDRHAKDRPTQGSNASGTPATSSSAGARVTASSTSFNVASNRPRNRSAKSAASASSR